MARRLGEQRVLQHHGIEQAVGARVGPRAERQRAAGELNGLGGVAIAPERGGEGEQSLGGGVALAQQPVVLPARFGREAEPGQERRAIHRAIGSGIAMKLSGRRGGHPLRAVEPPVGQAGVIRSRVARGERLHRWCAAASPTASARPASTSPRPTRRSASSGGRARRTRRLRSSRRPRRERSSPRGRRPRGRTDCRVARDDPAEQLARAGSARSSVARSPSRNRADEPAVVSAVQAHHALEREASGRQLAIPYQGPGALVRRRGLQRLGRVHQAELPRRLGVAPELSQDGSEREPVVGRAEPSREGALEPVGGAGVAARRGGGPADLQLFGRG